MLSYPLISLNGMSARQIASMPLTGITFFHSQSIRFNLINLISDLYSQYSIVSVLGIPGSIIACYFVEITRGSGRWTVGGRKFAMALATALTGVFLFLFTTAKTPSQTLAYSCVTSLTQNAVSCLFFFPGCYSLDWLDCFGRCTVL